MEKKPSRMFDVLRNCGALKKIIPELDSLWRVPQPQKQQPEDDTGAHVMMVIDYAARRNFSLPVRFAALMHDLGKGTSAQEVLPRHIGHEERSLSLLKNVCKRLRVPNDCKELAQLAAKFHGKLHQTQQMAPRTLLEFLIELDAIRQPGRFKDFLKVCEADLRGRTGFENCDIHSDNLIIKVHEAVSAVDAGAVAQGYSESEQIKLAVFDARLKAVLNVI
jgi:tRNA nucleotidyltransferase (CCA-adding enzyme)